MNRLKRNAGRIVRRLLRNLVQAVPTILVIVTLGFVMVELAPGDAADYLAAESGSATAETMDSLRRQFGLDVPVLDRLVGYYATLARFSLGTSPRYGMPVADLIMDRIPATLALMGSAVLIAVLLGLVGGALMATRQGRWPDRVLSVAALLFYSIPSFWIGLMLIILFSVRLEWLPSGGAREIGGPAAGLPWLGDRLRHLVLPALSLGLYYVAIYARLTRAAMIEAAGFDHVRTAISKGIGRGQVVRRHILRNSLVPISTMAGNHVAGMLGGAVVIETVFSWPGMGRLAYEAMMARDYSVLLGILIVSALMVIFVNMMVDLLHTLLDPRVTIE